MPKRNPERRARERGQNETLSWEAKVVERLRKRVTELGDSDEKREAGLGWERRAIGALRARLPSTRRRAP